jgi:hypothetical protein
MIAATEAKAAQMRAALIFPKVIFKGLPSARHRAKSQHMPAPHADTPFAKVPRNSPGVK